MSMRERRRMLLATLGGGIPLSDLPEGSILKILEGGVLADFYVAKHNYESGLNGAGRTLLVRKDCYGQRQWHSFAANAWSSCNLRFWLSGDYMALFSSKIKAAIGTTKVYYTKGDGDTTVTTRRYTVFPLSVTELGKTSTYANVEGTALPIASTLQIAYLNGSAVAQWTRTPNINDNLNVCNLDTNGNVTISGADRTKGVRPCFTLPADATVNPQPNADGSYTLSL